MSILRNIQPVNTEPTDEDNYTGQIGPLKNKLKRVKFFTKTMKLPRPVLVPVRKKGLTGSGRSWACHTNVAKLVQTYGGKDVRGYMVRVLDPMETGTKDVLEFAPHSVWETPEGNLVDVTLHPFNEEVVTFFPMFKSDTKRSHFHSRDLFIVHAGMKMIILSPCQSKGKDDLEFTKKSLTKFMSKQSCNLLWEKIDKGWFDEHPDALEQINFSKPSTVTGKLFEFRDVA